MKFGTVFKELVTEWPSLGAAKEWAKKGDRVVVIEIEEREGYTGVVTGESQIMVEGVENGMITTGINGKRVLILDPVYVSELEVKEVD